MVDSVIYSVLPDPESAFGKRVRERLRDEQLIWFITVGADGTPQPNPVWFLQQDDGLLVYNAPDAYRLAHIRRRPEVSLHFDSDGHGEDVVVLRGRARVVDDVPLPHQNPAYMEKYASGMRVVSGTPEAFSDSYYVPVLVEVTKVRGF